MSDLIEELGMGIYILIAVVIICLVCLIAKLISNSKKSKQNDIENTQMYENGQRNNVSFAATGEMREITLEDIEEREHNAIQYIENPLPVPKRREHKEMDYAIDVSDDSDYDLQDMTGIDYFDFE